MSFLAPPSPIVLFVDVVIPSFILPIPVNSEASSRSFSCSSNSSTVVCPLSVSSCDAPPTISFSSISVSSTDFNLVHSPPTCNIYGEAFKKDLFIPGLLVVCPLSVSSCDALLVVGSKPALVSFRFISPPPMISFSSISVSRISTDFNLVYSPPTCNIDGEAFKKSLHIPGLLP